MAKGLSEIQQKILSILSDGLQHENKTLRLAIYGNDTPVARASFSRSIKKLASRNLISLQNSLHAKRGAGWEFATIINHQDLTNAISDIYYSCGWQLTESEKQKHWQKVNDTNAKFVYSMFQNFSIDPEELKDMWIQDIRFYAYNYKKNLWKLRKQPQQTSAK